MNNLSSYCGLTDSRMSASDTDLPVPVLLETLEDRFKHLQEKSAESVNEERNSSHVKENSPFESWMSSPQLTLSVYRFFVHFLSLPFIISKFQHYILSHDFFHDITTFIAIQRILFFVT